MSCDPTEMAVVCKLVHCAEARTNKLLEKAENDHDKQLLADVVTLLDVARMGLWRLSQSCNGNVIPFGPNK
jgi:hypothetical protein